MSLAEIQASAPPHAPLSIPPDLIRDIRNGKCVLFLGAMASAPTPQGCRFHYSDGPPSGGQLCEYLVGLCGYSDKEPWNLARVSLYFQTRKDRSRHALIDAIAEKVGKTTTPSPALQMLAALPFPIIITTNYDQLFETAIRNTRSPNGKMKQPIIHIYDPKKKKDDADDDVPLDPSPDKPIVFKLHGDIEKRDSIVVTEEDYITFIQRMSDEHLHPVPQNIRARLHSWRVLFIGYSLKDYNLRLLLRTLRWKVDPANLPLSFSVDPKPDDLIVEVWQRGEKKIVNFIEHDLWDFVPALYREYTGADYQPPQ